MAEKYGISDDQYQIVLKQAERRAEMRKEFLKQTTNPWKQAAEAGYVFDPAHQRFLSMKVTGFERFQPNRSNSLFGFFAIVAPMVIYGYFIQNDRNKREQQYRTGEVLYKDRAFKLT